MAFSYFFLSLIITAVTARNNWQEPCFNGVCEYNLPASVDGASSGTLKIWGPESSIGDITRAGGWEIINCAPDLLVQDIRIVCIDPTSTECSHLEQDEANPEEAVGKIIRLPENCGRSAFAVVTKAWIPEDQEIPSNVMASLVRRDGVEPLVQALSLSDNLGAPSDGQRSKVQPVNFAIQAANVEGADGEIDTSEALVRRGSRVYHERGLFDFVKKALDGISKLSSFDLDKSTNLPAIDVSKNFNLFEKSISCPPLDAGVKIDLGAKAHAVASIGVAVSGTILPPKIDDFGIISSLNANLDGILNMKASLGGTLDSGKIKVFEAGIAGLNFPGVLSIGPSFVINAQAKATLDANVDLALGINYAVNKATLRFPPKQGSNGGSFKVGDTPLKLSANAKAAATGTVEAHVIPALNFGISALGDSVKANIFLDLDASAKMTLALKASASASTTKKTFYKSVSPIAAKGGLARRAPKPYFDALQVREGDELLDIAARTAEFALDSPLSIEARQTSATFGGCFDIGAGFSVNAGADANFFGLFDKGTKVELFKKNFELFKKCFGETPARRSIFARDAFDLANISSRSSWSSRSLHLLEGRQLDLQCLAPTPEAESSFGSLVDELISSSKFQ